MRHVIEVYMNYKAILKSLLFVKNTFFMGTLLLNMKK